MHRNDTVGTIMPPVPDPRGEDPHSWARTNVETFVRTGNRRISFNRRRNPTRLALVGSVTWQTHLIALGLSGRG